MTARPNHDRRALLSSLGLGAAALASAVAKKAVACTPPTPVSATITVACVTDYLDPPTISTIAAAAQEAADAIACDGGMLYFPEGLHEIDTPIVISSKVWVLGAGAGTVLQRAGSADCVLRATDVVGVRISNMAFDVNAAGKDGACGVELNGTNEDVAIEQCVAFTSTQVAPEDYACAISANNLSRSRIRDNLAQGLGIFCSGTTGPSVQIKSNHIVAPLDYGVAVVMDAETDNVSQVVIEGNLIESPGSAGIIVGARTESVLGEALAAIVVANNTVTGDLPGPGYAIIVRPAQDTRDIAVRNNIVSNQSEVPLSNSVGIACAVGQAGSSVRGLLVHGNSIRRTDLAGILVLGSVAGASVVGNILDQTRGLQLISLEDGIEQLIVANNIVKNSAGQGVLLDASYQSISQASVANNQVNGTGGYGCSGLRLIAGEGLYLEAEVRSNRIVEDQSSPTLGLAVTETSIVDGVLDTRYFNNVMSAPATPPAALSSNAVAVDNAGLATDVRGTATISGTSSSVQVNLASSLSFALTSVSQISATLSAIPSNWKTPASGQFWVTRDSDTLFSIHCDPPPISGETLQVSWRVTVRSA